MTTEEIIQRLLDEKHITVKEAMQMIRDLVRNEIFIPGVTKSKDFPGTTTVVMYGVIEPPYSINDDTTNVYNVLSDNKD